MKSLDFSGSEICWPNKYEIWSEMGPYGSVGAHIKLDRGLWLRNIFKLLLTQKSGL